jgi:mono/diheme cytochrome c family protein
MLDPELQTTTPTTAWRALDVPGKGAILLHQRALTAEIQIQPGGYGAGSCGGGIVQSSITVGLDGGKVVSADLAEPTLAVDMASDPDGVLLAVVAPGNFGTQHQLLLFSITGSSPLNPNAPAPTAPEFSPDAPGGMFVPPTPCMVSSSLPQDPSGQATAVTFVSANELAVQEREPAGISFIDTRTGQLRKHVDLGQPSRFDTGHAIFHQRAGAGIACASCHAEAGDDGHVWTFHDIGARRTQTLRGGILGTEPLHWNGDMQDFPTLVEEVFVGRMAGFTPSAAQTDSLSHWIDRQPALSAVAADAASAARGEALFQSEAVGCSGCHSGVHLTNNQFADVGTGAMLQVPSLRGVSFRLPVMHDGCASTLSRRFDAACGGGDSHGHTSQLAPNQLVDLIAYLETL